MGVLNRSLSTILVLGTRALFILHSFITMWFLTTVLNNLYYAFSIVLIFYIVEGYWVLMQRKGREWTWFSIPVLLYLSCVVPCIWLLRIDQIENYQTALNCTVQIGLNNDDCRVRLPTIFGVTVPLKLDPNTWIEVLDQSLLFVLIVTRWLAPFGQVSHRKLSQLLLVYVGLGSDIVELFVLFEDQYVLTNRRIVYWILVVWSVSLTQFMLPLTGAMAPSSPRRLDQTPGRCRDCMRNEAWTVLAIVVLQDGPFLAIRLYIMIAGSVLTYSLVFFTCKNILVICLQIYRFIATACCVDPSTGRSFRRRPVTDRSSSGTTVLEEPGTTPAPQGSTNNAVRFDTDSDSSEANDPV